MDQVITANRLRDGVVVFWASPSGWVERLENAHVFTSVDAVGEALKTAQKDEFNNVVLDLYAIDVRVGSGPVKPLKLREAIRAQGPTVHPEHGKIAAPTISG